MAEITKLSQINSAPGVKRDGTDLDSDHYVDAQWCRFMRGRPKKMGGYQEVSAFLPGIIRSLLVWSRGNFNALVTCSETGIHQANLDSSGGAGTTYDRTPAVFTDFDGVWTMDTMYDDAVGSQNTIIVAHRNNALDNIDEPTEYPVYYGIANDTTVFAPIAGLEVSGGIVCIPPYLVYYGSDGLVGWSDANQPQTLTSGDAGSDRITGAKVVKGLPFRSSGGPACVLWSLDSVIRMDYVGGSAIFKFSTLSAQSSILSQSSVIEYDGDYFWVGVDRFMTYAGGKVQELPNNMNKNWFFDNLNFDQRQKVWVTKIPRFGEIIWFFPFGDATECNKAIVFNVIEKTWYDFDLSRTAGYYSQVFNSPVWAGDSSEFLVRIVLDNIVGTFELGDSVTGTSSGDTGIIMSVESADTYLVRFAADTTDRQDIFVVAEGINNNSRAGTADILTSVNINVAYVHEKGYNAVTVNAEEAIRSYFETSDFGYTALGVKQGTQGLNRWTRLVRIEPDFIQSGDMSVEVLGREFAQQAETTSAPLTFSPDTGRIDLREQCRQIRLRFTSNEINGNYEMGRVLLHTEPGDVRS